MVNKANKLCCKRYIIVIERILIVFEDKNREERTTGSERKKVIV